MKIGLSLSFQKGSKDGSFFYFLYDKYIKFEPYSFCKGFKGMPWNSTKHPDVILQAKKGESISVFDKLGNIFSVDTTGTPNPHQSVIIEQDILLFNPSNDDIEKLVSYSDEMVATYLHHAEYTFIQSHSSESTFAHKNFPEYLLNTLKNVPFKLGVFDDKDYDVRFNPGRKVLIGHTWIMAAWKMWFGKSFFELVPMERILKFPYAFKIEKLSSGQIFVQLFEKVEESHTPDSAFRQWKWQEWLNYDELTKENV